MRARRAVAMGVAALATTGAVALLVAVPFAISAATRPSPDPPPAPRTLKFATSRG